MPLGDLVLQRVDVEGRNVGYGELKENWEGSYRVQTSLDKGTYVELRVCRFNQKVIKIM